MFWVWKTKERRRKGFGFPLRFSAGRKIALDTTCVVSGAGAELVTEFRLGASAVRANVYRRKNDASFSYSRHVSADAGPGEAGQGFLAS
jgi:hypothetical protein